MSITYLYNAGTQIGSFSSSGNITGTSGSLTWSNSSSGQMATHTYLAYVDLSNVATIEFSCTRVYAYSDSAASASLKVGSSTYTLVDTGSVSNVSKSVDVSSLTGYAYVGFSFYGNSYFSGGSGGYAYGGIESPTLYLTPSSYTITLQSGTGISAVSPAASNSVSPGNSITIDATVKDGYTWTNWTNTSTGTVLSTTKNHTFTPTAAASYTANATANYYTATLDANGGTYDDGETTTSTPVQYGSTYIFPLTSTISRPGYTLKGWYTAPSGGTEITESSTHTTVGDITLYAQWTANTYTVKYNANGGAGDAPSDLAVNYDSEFTTEGAIFIKDGYVLSSWNTNAGGTGTSYALNATVKNLATTATTITLYAQWKQMSVMFVYYNNAWKAVQ